MSFNTTGEVVPLLRKYSSIIVTGPQRSGTTAVSVMMAQDLEYLVWDERHHENNFTHVMRYAAKPDYPGVVIQAPALSWCIERLPRMRNVLVVWMLRDREEIDASQNRIGWPFEREELSKYITKFGCKPDERIFDAKLNVWRDIQSKNMRVDFKELDYASEYVTTHPVFVQKKDRLNFGAKQVIREVK